MTEGYKNVTPSTTESARLQEIRARLDAWEKQKAVGSDGYFDGIGHYMRLFEDDIAWLLDEVERLTKRVRMYEVVKS